MEFDKFNFWEIWGIKIERKDNCYRYWKLVFLISRGVYIRCVVLWYEVVVLDIKNNDCVMVVGVGVLICRIDGKNWFCIKICWLFCELKFSLLRVSRRVL